MNTKIRKMEREVDRMYEQREQYTDMGDKVTAAECQGKIAGLNFALDVLRGKE